MLREKRRKDEGEKVRIRGYKWSMGILWVPSERGLEGRATKKNGNFLKVIIKGG